jgi:hypothetical protein
MSANNSAPLGIPSVDLPWIATAVAAILFFGYLLFQSTGG